MKRRGQAKMTVTEFQRFKGTLQAAKARKRRQATATPAAVVYSDALLRVSVVVETGGELWLCPCRPGGWSSRQRLEMTDAARSERLRPAHDVTPGWLGIDAERVATTGAGTATTGDGCHGTKYTIGIVDG